MAIQHPAIEAVRIAIWERAGYKFSDESMRHVIAAVLDSLPRAEMARAVSMTARGEDPDDGDLAVVDAAISAARATLLPGDAT